MLARINIAMEFHKLAPGGSPEQFSIQSANSMMFRSRTNFTWCLAFDVYARLFGDATCETTVVEEVRTTLLVSQWCHHCVGIPEILTSHATSALPPRYFPHRKTALPVYTISLVYNIIDNTPAHESEACNTSSTLHVAVARKVEYPSGSFMRGLFACMLDFGMKISSLSLHFPQKWSSRSLRTPTWNPIHEYGLRPQHMHRWISATSVGFLVIDWPTKGVWKL